ncbi:hypothetical protein AX15_000466 [Amanita polypyramis BW_CC]|nr:hypothetical protein AX15_000466 [Amanita polypyramis BW_CC]
MNEPRSGSPLATQSAPVSEREPHTLGSSSLCDNNYGLVSPGTNEDAEITEPRDIMNAQNLIRYLDSATNPDGSSENRNKNSGGGGVFDRQGTGMVTKDNREDNPMAPLTLSQLSPRKIGTATDLEDHVPAPSPPAAVMTSPMRVARKRPVSAITADHRDETSKKGKVVPRVVRNQVTDAENSDTQSLNRATRRRNIAPNRRGQGAMVKRSVGSGSGSGSRLKSSRLSSSGGATVSSASLSSSRQSRKVVATRADKLVGSGVNTTRTRGIVKQSRKRVVKTHVKESDTKESDLSVVNEPTMSLSTVPELSSLSNQGTGTASTSHLPVCSTSCDDNDSSEVNERITQEGATSHVNATKSGDFQFQFRLEERTQPQIAQNDARMKLRSYSRSQAQPGSNVLKARNSASMSSSLSNSRVIGSMTRSQFRYTHYRPVPDYKSQHALLESSLAQRKENIAPVLPLSFELHTDARAKERERFDAMVKEKEMEMEQEREAKRREREEQEEQEVRELRRRAVPKANAVPEWYKNAPRRKKTVEEGQDSEN